MPRCAFPTAILLQIGISALTTPTQLCRGISDSAHSIQALKTTKGPDQQWLGGRVCSHNDCLCGKPSQHLPSPFLSRVSTASFTEVLHIVLVISYQHADERHVPCAPREVIRHTASICCMLELVWWGVERRLGRWRCTLPQALDLLSRIHLVEKRTSSLRLSWGLHTYTMAHAYTPAKWLHMLIKYYWWEIKEISDKYWKAPCSQAGRFKAGSLLLPRVLIRTKSVSLCA